MSWSNIIFTLVLIASVALFVRNIKRIVRNIKLGKSVDRSDNPSLRWKTMLRVALGQSKMVVRPIAGIMHILLYVGFVIINIEVIEIIIDGIFGTHRVLSFMGVFYNFLIASFEVLAILVLVACVVFFVRRTYIVGVTYRVVTVEIKMPPNIHAPIASLAASPAPGPQLPMISGKTAKQVLALVMTMARNLFLQASIVAF